MDWKIIVLLVCNSFSSIGYSLLAPLYPTEARSKGVSEILIGFTFSSFAISNCITILFANKILYYSSRKKLLFLSLIGESLCTVCFGLLVYIDRPNLFIFLSILIRLMQGFASSLTAVLAYSIAASLCSEENVKLVIGYMELSYSAGLALGPVFGSSFFYLGGYSFPFITCGVIILIGASFIPQLDIYEEDENEDYNLLILLFDKEVLLNFLVLVTDMILTTYFHPILTQHLEVNFGIPLEYSSIFFTINMVSYFLVLPLINIFTTKFGLRFTIFFGLLLNSIGVLLIAPISILPQDYKLIILGLIILGFGGTFITIPIFISFIHIFRNEKLYDEAVANDLASSLYNLGINFGEVFGPIVGVYFTNHQDFEFTCTFLSFFSVGFAVFNFIVSIWMERERAKIREFEDYDLKTLKKKLVDVCENDEYRALRPKKIQQEDNISLAFSFRHRTLSLSRKSSRNSFASAHYNY